MEVVFRNELGLGGIERGALIEVVGEGSLDDLFCFPTGGLHGELGLRGSPGGGDQRGEGGLADVGEDLSDGLRVGEGVVLLGPGRDQRPQRSVGREYPVAAVRVDAGRGEDLGQAVQELQGRETQGGAAGEVG